MLLATSLVVGVGRAQVSSKAGTTEDGKAAILPGVERAATTGNQPLVDAPVDEKRTDDARLQARFRFETGMKLYEEGDFSLALLEFERAYSLVPEHRVLFNIGQVNIQLGRYARATRSLREYLKQAGERISAERRASVLADLEMLATRTASIHVQLDVAGVEIVFDNDVVATTPMLEPVLVDAGEHRLTIRKPGYITQTRPVALVGRDQLRLELAIEPEPQPVPLGKTIIVEHQRDPEIDPSVARRTRVLTMGWIGTGLLSTAWATTAYLGYSASHEREAKLDKPTTTYELETLKSSARHWYIAADVLGTLTLGATATMLYYTLSASRPAALKGNARATSAQCTLGFGPDRVTVSAQF